jgi:predicted Zn-dependent protease
MTWRGVRRGLWFLSWLLAAAPSVAETVVVAPGISVTRRSYDAPLNEMPFFGFRAKTPEQLAADQTFITSVEANGGRELGFRRALQLAQQALPTNDFASAARRYNQAYLLMPAAPEIYHGFAIIAVARFKDAAYAEELFATASRLKPGDPAILADQARLFLTLGRPAEAVPLLEIVVRDPQAGAMHWSNLGFAYAQTGQNAKACESLAKAKGKSPSPGLQNDLVVLEKQAAC